MTKSAWPFVNQATTDLQYSKLFRILQRSAGIVGDPIGTQLKGRAAATGLQSIASPGDALVRGFYFESTADEPINHTTADATNPRIDRVILRLDFNQTLANRVVLTVLDGQPSTNPTAPALTQLTNGVWEISLYQVRVNANATTLTDAVITDERIFIGNQIGRWTTGRRPTDAREYDMGFNETLGYFEYYSATSTWEKVWKGITWADILNKPTTSTLDGRTIFVQTAQPVGVNGDIWFEV